MNNLDLLATTFGGLFAGASLYISYTQVPSLNEFGIEHHWNYFPLMYRRGAVMQVTSAIVAGLASLGQAFLTDNNRHLWVGSGCIFLGIIPYTLIFMMPTNNLIKHSQQQTISRKADLLHKWAYLHSVRTIASLCGFGLMIFGISKR